MSYLDEPLIKSWDLPNGIHVELRDASNRVEESRSAFNNTSAGIMKAVIPFVRDDDNMFPDYPAGANNHWIYTKNDKVISLLQVVDMDWNYELYPFDNCVELDNDPYCSGIERYDDEEEAHAAVIRLLNKP